MFWFVACEFIGQMPSHAKEGVTDITTIKAAIKSVFINYSVGEVRTDFNFINLLRRFLHEL